MQRSSSESVVCRRNIMMPKQSRTMILIAASLVLGMVHLAQAQLAPFLVKDINLQSDASCGDHSLSDHAVLGDSVYFAAGDCTHGMELWKSDGTEAGTTLIKDVYPGLTGSRPRKLTAVGGRVLFLADDGVHGLGLWRSDGSEAGTVLVKAPFPGSTKTSRVRGIVFLFDGLSLWRSDGTEVGTRVVKQFDPAEYSNESSPLVSLEDSVLFSIYRKTGYWGGAHELWKSDGTAAGTVLVTEVEEEPSLGADSAIRVGANVFFSLETRYWGNELWKSDGTAAGTRMVTNINPGYRDSIDPRWGKTLPARRLAEIDGTVFFTADDGTHGPELWRSDGTWAGTMMVKDIVPGWFGSSPAWLTNHEGTLFFVTLSPSEEIHLWRSDGTADGTVLVKSSTSWTGTWVYDMIAVGGTVFFSLDDGGIGREIWGSDGTAQGTRLIRDINPGPGGSDPRGFVDANGRLVMIADDGSHGPELWTSDGTGAGTRLVRDIDPSTAGSRAMRLMEIGGVVFLIADDGIHGLELWRTDGSEAGTTLVADINPGPEPSWPYYFQILDDTLFFWADDGTHGRELWRSDGTPGGTTLVADINTGEDGSFSHGPRARTGRHFFFVADDGIHGRELWRSDGTEAGTVLVKDVNPAGDAFQDHTYREIVTAGGTLFFVADDGIHGRELWKSDGTEAGTMLVADIEPGTDSSYPGWLVSFNGMVFFGASADRGYVHQPWRSDGTVAGTIPLAEFDPALSSIDFVEFREVEGTMYFSVWAEEGDISLWRTDGTPEGTVQVTPFGTGHHDAPSMVMLDGTLFLLSTELGKLWKTDGTVEGTTLVKRIDLPPDWYDYEDDPVCCPWTFGGRLFFSGLDANFERELWVSDGTEAGTVRAADIGFGSVFSSLGDFTISGSTLLFTAYTEREGHELWAIPTAALLCGDGRLDPFEACDDGNTTDGDGCDTNCTWSGCGNGIVAPDEQCDDGNTTDGDGCDANCTWSGCGNGIVAPDEQCDDGNTSDGDGCGAGCQLEGECALAGDAFAMADCKLETLLDTDLCGVDPMPRKLARVMRKRVNKARILIEKSRVAAKQGRTQKLLRRARKHLAAIPKVAGLMVRKKRITATCQEAIGLAVAERIQLLRGLGT